MIKIMFYVITLFYCFSVKTQTPQILWWFDTDDSAFGQSAMGDINNDGNLNIVFGCYRNDSMIYALNAIDGSLLWKFNAAGAGEGCNDVAALIYDVDNNGFLDVVVPSSCNPKTFCFHGASGALKWTANTRGSDSPPSIADLDNDGNLEILHGQFGGYVICINGNDGTEKWEILVDPDSWIQTAPTIVDLDMDGQLDFVVATWHFSGNNKLYAYKGDDQSLLWSFNLADVVYHGTAVADLTQDGKPELIIGDYSGILYAIKGETGDTLWTFDAGAYIGSPVSIADLNGDGHCNIIFTSWYKVFALNHDGSILWQYHIPDYKQSFRGAALSDIDNDNLPDVIFGTSGGTLISLKGTTGLPLWTIDLQAHYGDTLKIDHAPIVGDFNNNGLWDVFVVGGKTKYPNFQNNYGRAYAIQAGSGKVPQWPMFQYDKHRTGNLCNTQYASAKPNLDKTLSLFPNPAHKGAVISVFSTECFKNTEVSLINLLGKNIFNTTIMNNTFSLPSNISTGIYLLIIQNNNTFYKSKLIIN
jgi:outer membrane protein assembly factor BamB